MSKKNKPFYLDTRIWRIWETRGGESKLLAEGTIENKYFCLCNEEEGEEKKEGRQYYCCEEEENDHETDEDAYDEALAKLFELFNFDEGFRVEPWQDEFFLEDDEENAFYVWFEFEGVLH